MCDDFFDDGGWDWECFAMAGFLAEEMTDEEKKHLQEEQEFFDLDKENEEYESGNKI